MFQRNNMILRKGLNFEKRLFNSTGLYMNLKLQTQPIIPNLWKVPGNYIAFSQKSFVLSPGLLYHLIRHDSGRVANKVFTSNPIVSLKEYLNGLKITNWTDWEAATDQQRYKENLSREFEKLDRVFEKPGRVFKMLSRVFVLQRGPCCPNQSLRQILLFLWKNTLTVQKLQTELIERLQPTSRDIIKTSAESLKSSAECLKSPVGFLKCSVACLCYKAVHAVPISRGREKP